MSDRRFGSWLSLLRQGLSVEREFGRHSLETLVCVAETIEESVYERGSLSRTATGIDFCMNNPPLRLGAFSAVRLSVNGVSVAAERVRLRRGPGLPWQGATAITGEHPLELGPGARIEFAVDGTWASDTKELTVRLEFQSMAIPPLVWFEFTEALHDEGSE